MENKKVLLVAGIIVIVGLVAFWLRASNYNQTQKQPEIGEQTNQGVDYRSNCTNAKFPQGQELDISADPATGLVSIGYIDENGQRKETVLNYKSNDEFVGCSEDAKKVLAQVLDNEKK